MQLNQSTHCEREYNEDWNCCSTGDTQRVPIEIDMCGSLSVSGVQFTLFVLYKWRGCKRRWVWKNRETDLHASCSTKTKPDSRTSSAAPGWRPPWAPCMAAACDRTTASWAPRPLPWWRLRRATAAAMWRSAALPLASAASPPTWAATSPRSPSLHLDPQKSSKHSGEMLTKMA